MCYGLIKKTCKFRFTSSQPHGPDDEFHDALHDGRDGYDGSDGDDESNECNEPDGFEECTGTWINQQQHAPSPAPSAISPSPPPGLCSATLFQPLLCAAVRTQCLSWHLILFLIRCDDDVRRIG